MPPRSSRPPSRSGESAASSRRPTARIWKIATSAKKDTDPADRTIDEVVILLGAGDVKESKQFYVDHGLEVAKSFGRKYVEFASPAGSVKLALYGRRAAAKDAGVPEEGSGSHRIVIRSQAGAFTDPDGFVWASRAGRPGRVNPACAASLHRLRPFLPTLGP